MLEFICTVRAVGVHTFEIFEKNSKYRKTSFQLLNAMALDLYADYFLPYEEDQMDASALVKGLCRVINQPGK